MILIRTNQSWVCYKLIYSNFLFRYTVGDFGNFFLAYVFAHNIAAWSYVPGTDQMPPMANILSAAGFTWLGFYLPVDLSAVA